MASTPVIVRRSLVKTFLNTGTTLSPTWSLIGLGVVTGKVNMNPNNLEETYIHQTTGITEVMSYKPTIPTEMTVYAGDTAFDFVDNLRINRSVLADAHAEVVNVWLYKTPSNSYYQAERQSVSIGIDDFGGDGGQVAKINFTINYLGDPTKGTFNPSTLTFQANPSVSLLTSLALGGLTLVPAFSSSFCLYTAATDDATNTITAASTVAGATVDIDVDGTTVSSGDPATWTEGVNHVTITVSVSGEDDGIYRVDVTYTPAE